MVPRTHRRATGAFASGVPAVFGVVVSPKISVRSKFESHDWSNKREPKNEFCAKNLLPSMIAATSNVACQEDRGPGPQIGFPTQG